MSTFNGEPYPGFFKDFTSTWGATKTDPSQEFSSVPITYKEMETLTIKEPTTYSDLLIDSDPYLMSIASPTFHPPSSLTFYNSLNQLIVTIRNDGKIELNPDMFLDQIAKDFWDVVRTQFPLKQPENSQQESQLLGILANESADIGENPVTTLNRIVAERDIYKERSEALDHQIKKLVNRFMPPTEIEALDSPEEAYARAMKVVK